MLHIVEFRIKEHVRSSEKEYKFPKKEERGNLIFVKEKRKLFLGNYFLQTYRHSRTLQEHLFESFLDVFFVIYELHVHGERGPLVLKE